MAIRKDNKLMALLSIWGILLVCLGHSGFEEPIIQTNLSGLHQWIYSFHMPLFFLISGYLFSLTNKDFLEIETSKFLVKKAKRLLVPYVVLGTILFGIKFAFSGLSHATRDFSVTTFFKMFVMPSCEGSTMGYLWFIFTLFMVFVLVCAMGKLRLNLKRPFWCLQAILFFILMAAYVHSDWFNLNKVFQEMPYFILGILLYHFDKEILAIANRGGIMYYSC